MVVGVDNDGIQSCCRAGCDRESDMVAGPGLGDSDAAVDYSDSAEDKQDTALVDEKKEDMAGVNEIDRSGEEEAEVVAVASRVLHREESLGQLVPDLQPLYAS